MKITLDLTTTEVSSIHHALFVQAQKAGREGRRNSERNAKAASKKLMEAVVDARKVKR